MQFHYTGKSFFFYAGNLAFGLAYPHVGVQYYMRPDTPSWFVAGGLGGYAGAGVTDSEVGAVLGGYSGHVGVGYEMARHWYIELDVLGTVIPEFDGTVWNIMLTTNLIGY